MVDIRNDNDIDNDNRKDINNIDRTDNDNADTRKEDDSVFLTKEELLAVDLAEGLDDRANLRFYLSVCRKYPESFLRRIYSEVKEVPLKKIKKSKGALFNYLVQKYDKSGKDNGN
jgi:hypothetical protein